MIRSLAIIVSTYFLMGLVLPVFAQGEFGEPVFVSEGTVTSVRLEEREAVGEISEFRIVTVAVNEKGRPKEVAIEMLETTTEPVKYEEGNRVLVYKIVTFEGDEKYFISGFARQDSLVLLLGIFVVLTVLVARRKGLFSLGGLAISFLVIFYYMLPQILDGRDPIFVSITAAAAIVLFNFYLAHGFNRQTSYAVVSTIITLVLTGVLSLVFVDSAHLTGLSTEEAAFLTALSNAQISVRELLLAGIIIGVVGILDDITISQTSVIYQLKQASPKIKFQELFMRGMYVGRDHIASLVNTLILVYASAALPLLLLFTNSRVSFYETINNEIIAEEIIRTLLASIGLVLAVPISTYIAAYFISKYDAGQLSKEHAEHMH